VRSERAKRKQEVREGRGRGVESGFVCVEASGKVQEGIARRAMHKITKEPKKKNLIKKKEMGGLTTYRHASRR
jgi:hypothetical protein